MYGISSIRLIRGEPPPALQAFAPPANGVADAAFRESITLSSICAKKGHFTGLDSPCRAAPSTAASFRVRHLAQFPGKSPREPTAARLPGCIHERNQQAQSTLPLPVTLLQKSPYTKERCHLRPAAHARSCTPNPPA